MVKKKVEGKFHKNSVILLVLPSKHSFSPMLLVDVNKEVFLFGSWAVID